MVCLGLRAQANGCLHWRYWNLKGEKTKEFYDNNRCFYHRSHDCRRLYCSQFHGHEHGDCVHFVNNYAEPAFLALGQHLSVTGSNICSHLFQGQILKTVFAAAITDKKLSGYSSVTRGRNYFSTIGHLGTLMKTCPMAYKIRKSRTKFPQIFNKPLKICPRLWRFCQNSEISPNLVTLLTTCDKILMRRFKMSKSCTKIFAQLTAL